jgi:alpha-ribazole phosphatase
MELYLIRHGEIEGASEKRYSGHSDVNLTENGRKELQGLTDFLSKEKFDALYCSDLRRTIQSAGIIFQNHSLEPMIRPELRERNFGYWEGMSFDEIVQTYTDTFHAWAKNPLRFSPTGGESTVEFKSRVVPAFEKIRKDHDGQKVAIVAHGGVNRLLICEALTIPLENLFRIEQDFGCLNIITYQKDFTLVKLLNYTFYKSSNSTKP